MRLRSLEQRDRVAAESLLELDELIDRANRRVVNRLLEIGHEIEVREWGLRMILVSRCLERIGDHAVDIGEQTAYLVTGEFREFTDALIRAQSETGSAEADPVSRQDPLKLRVSDSGLAQHIALALDRSSTLSCQRISVS